MRRNLGVHARSLPVGPQHAGGVEQHRGVLIAAAMIGGSEIALPLVLADDHALAATPYSVLGGLAGFVRAGLSLRFRLVCAL